MKKNVKFILQQNSMDCGPTCLAMICKYYGKDVPIDFIRKNTFLNREGVSMLGISQAAQTIGFETLAGQLSLEMLDQQNEFPCILFWREDHFVVLTRVFKKKFRKEILYEIIDPSLGKVILNRNEFIVPWVQESEKGIALFLKPTEKFFNCCFEKEPKISVNFILKHILPHKKQFLIMFLLLLIGSGTTLIFPFLTQELIDRGVNQKNIGFIQQILIAQLLLFLGTASIEIFRNRIVLLVGSRISISIVSDFFKKLLGLPISFFESKMIGDINQRVHDNNRIEEFLTSQSLTTLFSMLTFFVYFVVLWYYSFIILAIYLSLTILALFWSFFWLKKLKLMDYKLFFLNSKTQSSIYEIITGASEMKLNNFEDYKRLEWQDIQENLLVLKLKSLKLSQFQLAGFEFFNQLKNIIVTFIAASLVTKELMSIGALLSVSFIIGQMNSPVSQLVEFFRSLQQAKLSLLRLNDIQTQPTEEKSNQIQYSETLSKFENGSIKVTDLSFQYNGPMSPLVLNKINLEIPEGKITAIVGASGSGKSTLIKLLLNFYEPTNGNIFYNNTPISLISPKSLRENCGVVMQDGFIFSDTIYRNIVLNDTSNNMDKFNNALKTANISNFIKELPLEEKTKIGDAGNGISGGQKQRLLIARAVYKDPKFLFFDEATSSLDAENEKIIHNNLQVFFKNKTVVIVAHRLSTVKNADQIIVLDKGKIVETGNHNQLVQLRGAYYNLVKNQLELGD